MGSCTARQPASTSLPPRNGTRHSGQSVRRYFHGRYPGGLQLLHAIAGDNQHVPTLGQIGSVPQWAMPRHDLGVVVGQGQNFFGCDNPFVYRAFIVRFGSMEKAWGR